MVGLSEQGSIAQLKLELSTREIFRLRPLVGSLII